MTRKNLVKIHLLATALAVLVISSFFILSLIAELNGNVDIIKAVKQGIFYALPIMILTMPTLVITGNKLAGNSKNSKVIEKKRRMKFVLLNGIILISLAVFLYYQSHFKTINSLFLIAQIFEFAFGLGNLVLIGLNARAGLILSGKIKPQN